MTLPISIQIGESARFWRRPHDLEIRSYDEPEDWRYGGDGYRQGPVRDTVTETDKGMPEVYRMLPGHQTSLPCAWVRLWRAMNPKIGVSQFGTLLSNNYVFTNNTGWPGRRNCLTGENMEEKDPAFHEVVVTGGAVFKEKYVADGDVYVEHLVTSQPVPDAEWVVNRPWLWFWVTTVIPGGQVNLAMKRGMDNQMYPVRVPLLAEQQLHAPAVWLDRLPDGWTFQGYDPRWMP